MLDDHAVPSAIPFDQVYTALYQYSTYDKDRAATFILSLVEESVPGRRLYMMTQLYEHCGARHALFWYMADDDARRSVLNALQSHSVFQNLQQARLLKHQCLKDVCLGLRATEPRQ